jgi:hypothetical protein
MLICDTCAKDIITTYITIKVDSFEYCNKSSRIRMCLLVFSVNASISESVM